MFTGKITKENHSRGEMCRSGAVFINLLEVRRVLTAVVKRLSAEDDCAADRSMLRRAKASERRRALALRWSTKKKAVICFFWRLLSSLLCTKISPTPGQGFVCDTNNNTTASLETVIHKYLVRQGGLKCAVGASKEK